MGRATRSSYGDCKVTAQQIYLLCCSQFNIAQRETSGQGDFKMILF